MAAAAKWDIVIEEGADFVLKINYLGSDCATIDVTSYGALMEIREAPDEALILKASDGNSRITVGGTNGLFDILIPAASTSVPSLPFTRAQYDVKIYPSAASPAVNPIRLVEGKVRYSKQISESP